MAKVSVVFHQAGNRSVEREPMPVPLTAGARSEVITSSGTSAKSTLVAEANVAAPNNKNDGGFVTIVCATAIWVNTGPLATVVAKAPIVGTPSNGYPVAAGMVTTIGIAVGDAVAVIDWTP